MAQTMEHDGAAKKAPAPATQTPAPKGITREVFQAKLKSFFSPPPAPAGAAGAQARPKGGMMKMMFGMLAFMLAAEFVSLPLGLVNAKLNLGLDRMVLVPAGVPLLGGMTAFLLLYFAAILGLWIVLLKLIIIPRDPFGVKASQRARTQAAAAAATRRAGGPRTRAERRHATTAVAAKDNAKETSKSASGTRNTMAASATRAGQPGKPDDAYERARAAAQKKRRAARR